MKIIAKVRLNRGHVAYFDPKTRIHLTISHRDALIYDTMETKNIRRGVYNGTLSLVSGSLVKEQPAEETEKQVTPGVKESKKIDEPIPAKEEPVIPEVKELETKPEEVHEEVKAEPVVEDEPATEDKPEDKVEEADETEDNEDAEDAEPRKKGRKAKNKK